MADRPKAAETATAWCGLVADPAATFSLMV